MREFSSALNAAEAESKKAYDEDAHWPHETVLDGRILHYREPTEGEGMTIVLSLASATNKMTRFANIVDVFMRVLRPDDRDWLYERMMNVDDPLSVSLPRVLGGDGPGEKGMIHEVVEVWGGRPTERSNNSASPPLPDGSGSTPSTPGSTYSPFHSASS